MSFGAKPCSGRAAERRATRREAPRSCAWPLFFAIACALAPLGFALAQGFVPLSTGEGYSVERSQTVENAPRGSVGRKTTDREHRVGNTEETDGNEVTITFTFGGFVRKCPTAEGVVTGTFEYSLSYDEINTDDGESQHNHISRRFLAKLEGHVKDDAMLDYVDLEGEYTNETRGTRFPPTQDRRPVRTTFRPGLTGEPDWPAAIRAVEMAGDVAIAAVVLWAGEFYLAAQREWTKLNECVELSFDPPSESRAVGPNESVPVRMELKIKAEGGSRVGGAKPLISVLNSGSVSPTSIETRADAPVTLTYTASSQPRPGHGFKAETVSRAGHAGAEWRIGEAVINLTIEHSLWEDISTPHAQAGWALFAGTVKFDITLTRVFQQIPGRFDGEATTVRPVRVYHVSQRCGGTGSQTELWRVIATVDDAAKSLRLDAKSFASDEVGEWNCATEREVSVSLSDRLEPLDVPAVIGRPQTFQIPRDDAKSETLTVTVLAAPVAR